MRTLRTPCDFCGHQWFWHDEDQTLGTNPCSLCEDCERLRRRTEAARRGGAEPVSLTMTECPSCGQPAAQEWADATGLGEVEPRLIPGELTCFTDDCAYRIRRKAELDWIARNSNVAMDEALSYRGWDWWVGRVLVAVTVALWITTVVLWAKG